MDQDKNSTLSFPWGGGFSFPFLHHYPQNGYCSASQVSQNEMVETHSFIKTEFCFPVCCYSLEISLFLVQFITTAESPRFQNRAIWLVIASRNLLRCQYSLCNRCLYFSMSADTPEIKYKTYQKVLILNFFCYHQILNKFHFVISRTQNISSWEADGSLIQGFIISAGQLHFIFRRISKLLL